VSILVNLPYAVSFLMMLLGIYGVLSRRNLIEVVFGLSISSYGVNVLLVQIGYLARGAAPILPAENVVDPLMQAFVLTAIVVEFGLMMFILSAAMRIYRERGDMDLSLLRRLRG